MMNTGKRSLLPPKIPFSSISSSYTEYIPISAIGSKTLPKPKNSNPRLHQRTSSESFLEEHPSWLDELLDEPDTPVWSRAHRRSSSDSFAYVDMFNVGCMNPNTNNGYGNMNPSSWGSHDFYKDMNRFGKSKNKNKVWDPPTLQATKVGPSNGNPSKAKHCRQFGYRSRVRKTQYIAELERNVQALEAEGVEVSAEIEFVSQQNMILGMENRALKQRLEDLIQEQLVKCVEYDFLEREVGKLRSLYQHQLANSRDLSLRFSNLSLKPKEGRGSGSGSGQLH